MAEHDQQNVESESGDLSDLEPAAEPVENEQASASGRSWTNVAIIAVAIFICIAALFIFFLLRNQSSDPEKTADETRSATEADDEVWAAIQERGTIVVGTAADYPPFEFYDREFQPQFDKLRARLPVHVAIAFPVDEPALRAGLQRIEQDEASSPDPHPAWSEV